MFSMVLVGSGSVSFDTDPDPGKWYGFHGSGSATLTATISKKASGGGGEPQNVQHILAQWTKWMQYRVPVPKKTHLYLTSTFTGARVTKNGDTPRCRAAESDRKHWFWYRYYRSVCKRRFAASSCGGKWATEAHSHKGPQHLVFRVTSAPPEVRGPKPIPASDKRGRLL